MALPTDPNKLILTDADITRAGPLEAALDGKAPASRFQSGTGSPEGVLAAPPGTEYVDTVGTLGAWKWMKKAGTGSTGWQVVDGDTGWINIYVGGAGLDASLSLSTDSSKFQHARIRRVNNVVYFALLANVESATTSAWAFVPHGFRTTGSPIGRQLTVHTAPTRDSTLPYVMQGAPYIGGAGGTIRLSSIIDAGSTVSIVGSWLADYGWPTTLTIA